MKHFSYLLAAMQVLPAPAQSLVPLEGTVAVPPPAVPFVTVPEPAGSGGARLHSAATVYSIGDPTPEEQLYLELINRARANPAAEAARLAAITDPAIAADYKATGVDLALMQTQFGTLTSAQPLAMNARLTDAARAHSQDMFVNVFQDHTGSDGGTLGTRLNAVGYVGSAGENIYANAKSVPHGHAAFEVDWGGPASNGGMQSPPGHREAIHNPLFREVGIGVVLGSNMVPGKKPLDRVGPQLVTQDFGVQQNSTPFITGVAYYDLNGNKFYDIGEGIGNVHVSVSGSNFEAVTARSGGYAIPVPGNGNYTVTFSGAGFTAVTQNVSVVGSKNQKVDFAPVYNAPQVSGPVVPLVNRANAYSISTLPGASAYEWRSFQKLAAASEGAENDTARIVITQSGTYDVIEGIIVKSGSFAFHLITPSDGARSQYITLSPSYLVNNNSTISFQSMVGFGLPDQHARVQVSTDNGANWETIYNQDGDIDHPEQTWSLRTVSLAPYTGKAIRIRFAYEFFNGQYVSSNDLNVGWLFDDIQFTGTQEIVNEKVSVASGNTFQFTPDTIGDFSLQARGRTGHDFLDWGPAISVRSAPASGTPELQLSISPISGQLQITADLITGANPSVLKLESASSLGSAWQTEPDAVQSIDATRYRVTLTPPADARTRFYRLRAE